MGDLSAVLTVGGLGILFAGISGSRLLQARRLRGRGLAARAVVAAQQSMASPVGTGHGGQLSRPVLVFTTRSGQTVQVVSPVGRDHSDLLPGRTVTVYYDPADPSTVSVPEHEAGVYRLLLAAGLLLLSLVVGYAVLGDRMLDAVVGIPVFLGVVFTGIGYFGVGRTRRLKRGGRTDGIVVGAVTTESGNRASRQHALVRYQSPDGTTIEVPSTSGSVSRPPTPGTPVRVCYDRSDPQAIMLAHEHTPVEFWVFGVLGVVAILIGSAVLAAFLF